MMPSLRELREKCLGEYERPLPFLLVQRDEKRPSENDLETIRLEVQGLRPREHGTHMWTPHT